MMRFALVVAHITDYVIGNKREGDLRRAHELLMQAIPRR
jgi:hypothetical protein